MDNRAIYYDDDRLLECFDKNIKELVVPSSIRNIDNSVFEDCEHLESIKFDCPRLTFINCNAFKNCCELKEVSLPPTIRIDVGAFFGCSSLEKVVLQEPLEAISPYTFAYCESLKEIVLPPSLKMIHENAFSFCKSLTKLFIPKNIRTISHKAFIGCNIDFYISDTSNLENTKFYSVFKNNIITDKQKTLDAIIENNTDKTIKEINKMYSDICL